MVAMFAAMSFTLTACGDDNEPDDPNKGGSNFTINGVSVQTTTEFTMAGEWDSDNNEGTFTVAVNDKGDIWYYKFSYINNSLPKVGDNFASMNLTLEPLDDSDVPLGMNLAYSEGSAIVKSIDKSKEIMTIEFKSLKMAKNGYTYTFNGAINVDFEF